MSTVVLDTNVWLDWLVFDDPSAVPLRAAQEDGRLAVVASAETRAELAVVLARPLFGLDAAGVAARLAEHDRVAAVRAAVAGACTLRCTDADDQKFLDLSVTTQARLLVTKDRALLRMAARMQRAHGLRIARPADL